LPKPIAPHFATLVVLTLITGCGHKSPMVDGSKEKSDQDMKQCAFGSEQKFGLNISGSSDFKSSVSTGGSYEEIFKAAILHDSNIANDLKKLVIENYYDCIKKK
jgi:hypothetical protein